ncbi:ABC transporter permease [Inediibacterium massiliense]|uniref:ABC transporter permease n=1 Tax=Inediibacterium massiliense TaxID=1658111 RepID=UPI0006B60EE7|nr:ABC transporter permease [Inediibacterium massiliense]
MVLKKSVNKKIIIGSIMIGIIVIISIFSGILVPNDPNINNLSYRFENFSKEYPFGTDQFGRCILSRLIYGGYNTFSVVFVVMGISALISIIMGIIAGYYGGLLDKILTGLFDIFMSFPPFIYVMALIGVMGGNKMTLISSLVLGSWAFFTRTIRTQVKIENSKLYIQSSKICGSSDFKIITKHILPNIIPNIIVFFSLQISGLILAVSGFSFIGLGLQSDIPEWGNMIAEAREYIFLDMKMMIYPGVCIFFTVFAFNLLAEGIRERYEI